ncbi:MAG: ATP-binding protein [Actinomycetota bacterium]
MGGVRVRLLVIAVVVALVAVVATTLIAQRVATEDVRSAVERDLELEAEVAGLVEGYAFERGTWEGLDDFVDLVAVDVGERIAVIDDFGRTLADSEPGVELPTQPVARVEPDPFLFGSEAFERALFGCELLAEAEDVVEVDHDECVDEVLDELGEGALSGVLVYLGDDSRNDASLLGSDGPDVRLFAVALVVVVLAVALAAAVSWPLLAPIRTLRSGATRLGEGDLSARVPEHGATELADLARTFNAMADGLEADDERRRRWTSDIAHELRSPLQNLRGQVESAQDGLMAVDDGWYESVLDEVGQLAHLVEDLQTLTLADSDRLVLDRRSLEVADLARDVVRSHEARATSAGVDVDVQGAGVAEVDERRFRQVLGNLLDNAIRHTPAGGSVRITVSPDHPTLAVTVADTGEGIAPEVLPTVLDRFRRADTSRSRSTGGSGLGLAIVRSLVEAHGGTIEVASEPGEGTEVVLVVPTVADGVATSAERRGSRQT